MQAASHGADFAMARKVRASMTPQQMHDFSVGSEKGKPMHVKKAPDASSSRYTPPSTHPHKNLGAYLHPRKAR